MAWTIKYYYMCQFCHKEFWRLYTKTSNGNTPKYCSRECYSRARTDSGHFYICPTCGKRFKSHWKIVDKRYCSKKCHNKSMEKVKPVFTCKQCGKTFKIKFPGVTRRAYFCSRKCYFNWRGPTSIETAISKVLSCLKVKFHEQYQFGVFTFDFFIPSSNLIIECDGDYWHSRSDARGRDKRKKILAEKHSMKLLRLSESEINSDIDSCRQKILALL